MQEINDAKLKMLVQLDMVSVRDAEIYLDRLEPGKLLKDIGFIYGLSPNRVRVIVMVVERKINSPIPAPNIISALKYSGISKYAKELLNAAGITTTDELENVFVSDWHRLETLSGRRGNLTRTDLSRIAKFLNRPDPQRCVLCGALPPKSKASQRHTPNKPTK